MDNVALDSVTARVNHEKPYYSTKINYSAHTLTPLKPSVDSVLNVLGVRMRLMAAAVTNAWMVKEMRKVSVTSTGIV